jgi:hypothetical protein
MSHRRSTRGRSARIPGPNPRTPSLKRVVPLETLEERRLLATFTVTSNGDVPLFPLGLTLREAITMANAMPGADTIDFNIAGTPTIHPITALPAVTGPTTIDGTTQPGSAPGAPVVVIEGTGTLPDITGNADGLRLQGGSTTVRGLIVGGFSGTPLIDGVGIRVFGDANVLAGNWVGTDATGAADDGNLEGIVLEAATHTRIGGTTLADRNVISANFLDGVRFHGAGTGNVVSGNYVGVTAAGDAALANNLSGIDVQPSAAAPETTDLLIGGTAAGARNVISGNAVHGVEITDVSGVRIAGNYIGTDATGAAPVPNGANGISVEGAAGATTIGGTTASARNVISGNNGDGVQFTSTGAGNLVQGNYIGTDATGANPIIDADALTGNHGNGVSVLAGPGVTIGGATAAAGNVISANQQNGIQLAGDGSSVQFNLIGTDAANDDAATNLGNVQDGIFIDGSDNQIGTSTSGNTIAYNLRTGVGVAPSTLDLRNAIRGDNIYLNGALGIDLGEDGVTPNDPQDPDVGPNDFQNYPVLTSVSLSGSTATISGTLNSTPNSTFVLDFFVSQIWDTTTFGEGQKYLGSTTVTTDAAGNASFTATVPGVPSGWRYFAATATDSVGNTSEFSYDPTPGEPAASAASVKRPRHDKALRSWLGAADGEDAVLKTVFSRHRIGERPGKR